MLNNDYKFHIAQVKKSTSKFGSDEQLIMFNLDSLSFDVVFSNHSQTCPTMSELKSMKILAISKTQHLIQTILDLDFELLKKQILTNMTPFHSLVMCKIDLVPILSSSSMLVGFYPETLRTRKQDSQPPCFLTFNLTYIDLFKRMTQTQSILNQKFCDIDSTFGLHDYQMQIDVRNHGQSFFSHTFRKVFTNYDQFEKHFHHSPYKSSNKVLSRANQGYAVFNLIQSEVGDRFFYDNQFRFEGRPFYSFSTMIAKGVKLFDMAILDFVILDEFSEPMHYVSMPVKLLHERLFENQLNMDMASDINEDSLITSIKYEYSAEDPKQTNAKPGSRQIATKTKESDVVVHLQMSYKKSEDKTYVTNLEVKISLAMINHWFGTSY